MKIDFEDFDLLSKYLTKHCKGSVLSIDITRDNHFEIRTTNSNREDVTITVYSSTDAGHLLAPIIMKQERLKNCL